MIKYLFTVIIFVSTILNASEINNFILKDSVEKSLMSISFELDNISLDEKSGYTIINSQSKGTTSMIGMPKLPLFSTLLMLDPKKEYDISYVVQDSYIIDDVKIIPNQEIEKGLEKTNVEKKDLSFYLSSENYPSENIILSEPMIMRDLVLSNISVIPFKYYPSTNQLEVYQSIDINVHEVGDVADIRRREMARSRAFENIYKNSIINYDRETRDDYQQPSVLYIGPSSIIDNSQFEQLINWRRERGYVVYTATTSQTGSSASSIKNYIEDAYDDFDPVPEYVTLIGDVGGSYSLPTYYEDFGHDSYGNQCEGDHPYSQLDGNDLLPEVLIGRMSIRSSSELTTVVYKILNYEKATYLDNYPNYYERAAMAGDPSTSGNSCAITKEAIKQSLENHDFDEVAIKTSGSGWATWMENELEDGVLFFNYRGYLGMSGFSTSDVDDASNGWKLPFATILTCGTGSFAEDQTAMSEKFFRAGSVTNPRGGVAAIGTATWNTHTLFNNIVDLGIYNGLLADDVETAGAALASGKLALNNTYPGDPYGWISAFTQWNNLMGDAATHLFTDTPEVFSVSHNSEISYGTNYLQVEVLNSSNLPVSNSQVSLLINNNNIATNLYTNDLGQVTFSLNPEESNDMVLTVTKLDYKPYQSSITIENNNNNVNYNNNQSIIINDNNDDIVYAGETVDLSIPIINHGSQTASDIVAVLSSTSDKVVVNNSTVSFNSISSGSTAYLEGFEIFVLPSAKQYEDLELKLTITNGASNQWESNIPLDVMGSLLMIMNGGSAQPGQTTNLNITINNTGMLTASNISGELQFNGNQIQINDPDGFWGSLSSSETATSNNAFNITLSNDIAGGTQFVLQLLLESDEGYSSIENYTLTVGLASESDPMGPDQYGYYIYDSGDTNYDLAPDYDWIEISSIGNNLNLSNSGDGNWSGNGPLADISLPFTFKFYGVEYNELTICTNGWISPGSAGAAAFRNYPIPGAGGPTPMIAAFWDDLVTNNNGDVYVYSTNQYVIIQWDNMRTDWGNDNNTFQIIIYNDSAQPNGDNNIKIQYQDFNNTSSGSFTSYPPIHGSYATIGIENHLSNDGMQYTYYNNYARAAMELSDQTALYITTQAPISLPVAQLDYNIPYTDFEVVEGNADYSILTITNNGEEGSLLSYSVSKSYPDLESPFDVTGSNPDSYGYFWSDSDISNEINYEWSDISNDGIQVNFTSNDASTENIEIGFDFPFYGELYSDFIINANGWIGFGEDNSEWYNSNLPSTDFPKPAIFGFWDDLNPINDNCNSSCAGNVFYHSSSERLIVWFNDVAHWVSEGFENTSYDFQIIIYPSGEVDINISNIEGNYSATVGMQNATGTIASQVDEYDGNYFDNNMSIKFKRPFVPSDWLNLTPQNGESLSGELYDSESDQFYIEVNSENLLEGFYNASIIISSSGISDLEIPISLNVLSDIGLLGDLNGDLSINIQDVVLLVGTILGSGDFVENGDLNQDGFNDVVDIVTLVNIILDS